MKKDITIKELKSFVEGMSNADILNIICCNYSRSAKEMRKYGLNAGANWEEQKAKEIYDFLESKGYYER